MENKAKVDRSQWPSGPWDNEPDHLAFEHDGFPCIIHRVDGGHLCGYVAVPPGHPWYGRGWSDDAISGVHVHGGITYAEKCQGEVCHVPKPGESDDVWWLGFDHAHGGDARPDDARWKLSSSGYSTYKDFNYVRRGCESLAEQAKAAA